jgi:hypothetical protein
VAEPKLLVYQCQQLRHLGLAPAIDLEIEGAGEMQCFQGAHPRQRDVIVAPTARNRDRDFVLARAIERPIVRRSDLLDQVDGIWRRRLFEIHQTHVMSSRRMKGQNACGF